MKNYLDIPYRFYDDHTEGQLKKIKTSNDDQFTLWFEYDLFCQFNMMVAINLLLQIRPHSTIFLVLVGRSLEFNEWITLGQLTSKDWLSAYKNKKIIDDDAAGFMKRAWAIYCSDDHRIFEEIMPDCPSVFKYFPQAIENHYRRFPSRKDGLTDIQRYIFKNLSSKEMTNENRFIEQLLRHFHFYGYGDLQYKAIIASLSHFVDCIPNKGYRLIKDFTGNLHLRDYQFLPEMTYGGQSNKDRFLEDFIEI